MADSYAILSWPLESTDEVETSGSSRFMAHDGLSGTDVHDPRTIAAWVEKSVRPSVASEREAVSALEHASRGYGDDLGNCMAIGDLGFEIVWDNFAASGEQLSQDLLDWARRLHFDELYEDENLTPRGVLSEVVADVLAAFGDPAVSDRAWFRLGWMSRALVMAVLPTLRAHAEAADHQGVGRELRRCADEGQAALSSIESWLRSGLSPDDIAGGQPLRVAPQAANDAFGAIVNARSVCTRRSGAWKAMTEIVEDVLEGYAIIPGSRDRRALYDWWLDEVVPASYALRLPRVFWTVRGVRCSDLRDLAVC